MRAVVCTVALLLLGSVARAQTGAPVNPPNFDVVSIKLHPDEGMSTMGIRFNTRPDGVSFRGGSLDLLLRFAFNLPRDRLLNERDWFKSKRVDVEARVAPEDVSRFDVLSNQQRWALLIPALADRCHLKFHYEKRELRVYRLVVAPGGPKMKETPPDSNPSESAMTGQASVAKSPIMMWLSENGMTLKGHGATMQSLAESISQQMGSTIIDKTGLNGKFDYTLTWMPDEDSRHLMGLSIPTPPSGASNQSAQVGPSLFAALREQLGLKLESHTEPVDVVVIDYAEAPSAN